MRIAAEYFMTFILYSFVGWIAETLLYIIRDKKVVKRGFLFGPVCPIYGTGAIICTAVLYNRVSNIFLIFLYGMLLCGAIEYLTHFLMEKLFNAMWWDYSNRRFNIKGRIYLKGLVFFGIGAVLIVKAAQPLVFSFIDLFSDKVLYALCFIIYSVLLADITVTVVDLKNITKMLKYIRDAAIEKSQQTVDSTGEKLESVKKGVSENKNVENAIKFLKDENPLIKRIKKKYPDFTLKKYKEIWDIVMDKPIENKARTDIKLYGSSNETEKNNAEQDENTDKNKQ